MAHQRSNSVDNTHPETSRRWLAIVLRAAACLVVIMCALVALSPTLGVGATGAQAGDPNGGYWLVTANGAVYAFGGASNYGGATGIHLNAPIVQIISTPDGKGYWLVASDGGVFSYGDATFYGNPQTAGATLPAPVVGATAVPGSTGTAGYTDYWQQTHSNINLSATGGIGTTIETLALPAGQWVLHADQSLVNFGPSDYASCEIGDSANADLNAHRTMVGDPSQSGAEGPASFVTAVSETAAVNLPSADTITVICAHDHSNGSAPYVDSNADLSAHMATNLAITQLP